MSEARFHWLDYVVTVAMLLVPLGIGFFFSCYKGGQKTKEGYLLGNRQLSLAPVCLSLFVTFQSANSLIGIPAETYFFGPMILYINMGYALAYLIGFFTVVPLMYPLRITSAYEYLGLRFQSHAVRLLGTCIGMLQTMLYMGVALFAPALALQAAAGLPLWVSIAIVGGIGTLYTAVGGIKSVVWADAFQSVIVVVGMATVVIKGLMAVGGVTKMFDIGAEGGRTDFAVVNPDPRERHSVMGCLLGGCVVWLVNCFHQSAVQRICSLKSLRDAKLAYMLNVPITAAYGATLTLTGILLYAYIVTIGCDPYRAGFINNRNQIMPYFVIHVLVGLPGMAGIYMSMLFSGALSTLSSGINALAANSIEDILARPLRGLRDTTVTVIAKLLVVFYGLAAIGLAYLMKSLQGPVTELTATAYGACGGPLLGIFLLGAAFPRGNKYGAFVGGVIGLAVNLWIAVGSRLYGTPTPFLPPGPTHNCSVWDNASLPFGVNASSFSGYAVIANTTSEGVGHAFVTTYSPLGTNITSSPEERPFSIYDISYLWFGVLGMAVSLLSGMIISCVTGGQDVKALDSRLIIPFCRKLYKMPEPMQTSPDITVIKQQRQAWEVYRDRSTEHDTGERDNGHSLKMLPRAHSNSSERNIFLRRNEADTE